MKIILNITRKVCNGLAEDLKHRHGIEYTDRINEILDDYYSLTKERKESQVE